MTQTQRDERDAPLWVFLNQGLNEAISEQHIFKRTQK